MRIFLYLSLILINSIFTYGQNSSIHSNFKEAFNLQPINPDSALAIIIELEEKIQTYSESDKAFFYGKSSHFHQQIGNYLAEFNALEKLEPFLPKNSDTLFQVKFLQGIALFNSGDFEESVKRLNDCEHYFLIKKNEHQLAKIYSWKANIFTATGKIPEAIQFYSWAIMLVQKQGEYLELCKLYSNISIAYDVIGDFEKSHLYRLKEYSIASSINNEEEIHFAEINLGGSYNSLNNPDSAIYFLNKALIYFEQNFDARYLNAIYNELGKSYTFLGNYEKAEIFYSKSIDLLKNGGFNFALPGTLGNYGLVLHAKGAYQKGIQVCQEALPIAVSIQYPQVEKVICDCLYANFKSTNQTDSALVYLERSLQLKEQLAGAELQMSTLRKELESKYQNEKRDLVNSNREKLDKASYLRNILFIGISLLLISLLILFWAFRQKRKSVKLIEEERQYLDNLLHNIVHEFRTPLTLIKGPAEELLTHDKQNIFAGLIQKNSAHMLELVNQILDFAKLKAGKLPVINEVTDINVFFTDCIALFDSAAKQKQIQLTYSTLPKSKIISIDSGKLFKIISNLLSNAIKYSESGDKVKVDFSVNGNNLFIQVEDTGPGIAKEEIQKIFEKFYQVDSSTTRKAEGTGLGLAFVKELVSLLKGKIHLESSIGKGTTFFVTIPFERIENEIALPKNKEFSHAVDESVILSDEIVGDAKAQVLIVEDNTDLQKYLATILVEQDYEVLIANNGEEGINMAIEHIPDLIISDVMMPKVDGIEMLKVIKSNPTTNHIYVIMLTAKASFDSKIIGLESGADDYLTKPFSSAELLLRVNNALVHQQKIQKKNLSALAEKNEAEQIHPLIEMIEKITLSENGTQISAENLASLCALSRSQLHRKIIQLTGISTNALQTKIRMEAAKSDLKNTEMTISEIAFKYGYSDSSNFARVFKKQFEKSPSEFRNS